MPRQFVGFMGAAALQLVALVLAHELVYLARYGSLYGEALVHSGHGEAWGAAVTTSVMLALTLLGISLVRLARLGLLVRQRGQGQAAMSGAIAPHSLLRAYLRIAPRLVALVVLMLTVQENLERAMVGAARMDPGILLSQEYAGGLWIATAVGLVVSLVAALFAWRRDVLLARLRAGRARIRHHATTPLRRPARIERPAASLLGRRSALRAPPRGAFT